jgi:hypothetical protein
MFSTIENIANVANINASKAYVSSDISYSLIDLQDTF